MCIPAAPEQEMGEKRFLLFGVDWEAFETLLRLLPRTRMTYDRGTIELMSPQSEHHHFASRTGRLIDTLFEELEIAYVAAGSTTFRRKRDARALDADKSYYLGGYDRLSNRDDINLEFDPPPDLTIEIEMTSSSLDRMGIYATLGVPEVWRFDGVEFQVLLLREDRSFARSGISAAFPYLPMTEVAARLLDSGAPHETGWVKECRAWIRDVVAPKFRENPR